MKTQPSSKFLGLNNRLPDYALLTETGQWLSEAENVDFDNAGWVRRRSAELLVQALTAPHSVFELSNTSGFLVRASALYSFTTTPSYTETLVAVLTVNSPVYYAERGGTVYYSNGTDSGKIVSGVWYPLALPTPGAPTLAQTTGALVSGKYQVSVRYINNVTGEAGGLSASSSLSLAATGGVRLTLPAATTGATHVQVFMSKLNGSQVYLHSSVSIGTATVDLQSIAGLTTTGESEYITPMPACKSLFFHQGKLCGVAGRRLYYGASYRFGYYAPDDGYIDFAEDIAVAIGNQFGVYVATTDKSYWLAGNLKNAEALREPLPYGATFGTGFEVPHKKLVGWFGAKGFVVGDEQGQLVAMTQEAVDVSPNGGAWASVVESKGFRRVVSNGYCMNLETAAVSTYSDYAFTSINGQFGTKTDGLYRLAGGALKISGHISLGRNNFGSENLKSLPACYIGAASGEPMELRVTTPDGDAYEYEARSCSDSIEIHRIDPGKGLRENWFGLAVYNTDGSDFVLASVSFAPVASGRRI